MKLLRLHVRRFTFDLLVYVEVVGGVLGAGVVWKFADLVSVTEVFHDGEIQDVGVGAGARGGGGVVLNSCFFNIDSGSGSG